MAYYYNKEQMDSIAVKIGQEIKRAKESLVIKDVNTQMALSIWTGTQSQYDAISQKDPNILYVVKP